MLRPRDQLGVHPGLDVLQHHLPGGQHAPHGPSGSGTDVITCTAHARSGSLLAAARATSDSRSRGRKRNAQSANHSVASSTTRCRAPSSSSVPVAVPSSASSRCARFARRWSATSRATHNRRPSASTFSDASATSFVPSSRLMGKSRMRRGVPTCSGEAWASAALAAARTNSSTERSPTNCSCEPPSCAQAAALTARMRPSGA